MTAVMVASRAMVRSWNERILPWQRDPRHRVSPRILLLDRDAAVTLAALDPGAEMTDAIAPVIGILGGSGLYQIDGLVGVEWRRPSARRRTSSASAGSATRAWCSCRATVAATGCRPRRSISAPTSMR